MQHVLLRATWYEGTAQLLNLTEFEIAFMCSFILLAGPIKPMQEGRKPSYPEKTPDDELQKMPHTESAKIQAPSETDVLTVTPRAGPGRPIFKSRV